MIVQIGKELDSARLKGAPTSNRCSKSKHDRQSPIATPGPNCTSKHDRLPSTNVHKLPIFPDYFSVVATGVGMALVSFAMLTCDALIILPKFERFQQLINDYGLGLAWFFLVSVSALMVTLGAVLIVFVHPISAGSGLPEIKAYVNGGVIPGLFESYRNWVKAVGAVLATGAGLATGREGPLVTIGGSLGVMLVTLSLKPIFRSWVKEDLEGSHRQNLIVDEKRFAAWKRTGCVMGGAAGLAAAFNAPVGGLLYLLEEVTVSAWSMRMTMRTCAATIVAGFVTRLLMRAKGMDVHSLVIFDATTTKGAYHPWDMQDLPFFVLLAAFGGLVSAAYTSGLVGVWRIRQFSQFCAIRRNSPVARVVEVAVVTMVSVSLMALFPLADGCTKTPPRQERHERIFVRYLCDEGEHNELATLLLQGEEGAVKHLFSRDSGGLGIAELRVLCLCMLVYFPLATALAGLSIPLGNFIPSMFLGGLLGRFARHVLGASGDEMSLAHPGVYALAGSASVLGGFTHMTVAITVMLVEASQDIGLVGPLMLSVCVGRYVSLTVVPHDYNEQLMELKGVPFLEAECPEALSSEDISAGCLCDRVPQAAMLPHLMSLKDIQSKLDEFPSLHHFPVLDHEARRCTGLVPRPRLHAVVSSDGNRSDFQVSKSDQQGENISEYDAVCPEDSELGVESLKSDCKNGQIPIFSLADPAIMFVYDDMPLARVYSSFSRAGVDCMCVLSTRETASCGGVCGILERRHLAALGARMPRSSRPMLRFDLLEKNNPSRTMDTE